MSGPSDNSGAAEAAVWDALHTVVDPELGASLVDLGMIRAVRVAAPTATIELAPTMPSCPLANWLEDQVRSAILQISGIHTVDVRIVDGPLPSVPAAPWQHWLDKALASSDDERRRGEHEPVDPPQRSGT